MKNLRIVSVCALSLLLSASITKTMDEEEPSLLPQNILETLIKFSNATVNSEGIKELLENNEVAKSALEILQQANIDEEIRKELAEKAQELADQAKKNIRQDHKDIQVAAGLASLFEVIDKTAKKMGMNRST